MLNKSLVAAKIRRIQEYLMEVGHILQLPKNAILDNLEKLRTLERNFQLIVDEMLDINLHLIREMNFNTPDNLQNTFMVLADNAVLDREFAEHLAPVVGLRYGLVHGYEKINRGMFVALFQNQRGDFDTYMNAVLAVLDSTE